MTTSCIPLPEKEPENHEFFQDLRKESQSREKQESSKSLFSDYFSSDYFSDELSPDSSYELMNNNNKPNDNNNKNSSEKDTDTVVAAKVQSSNVTAFVTLMKALFGVSLLSSPRVLGETGLVLGTIVYSLLILACVGSCWCLLQARAQVAAAQQHMLLEQELEQTRQQQQLLRQNQQILQTIQEKKGPDNQGRAGDEGAATDSTKPSTSTEPAPISNVNSLLVDSKEVMAAAMMEDQSDSGDSNRSKPFHAITYGDLGRELLGVKQSTMINFLIVSLHILFGAGLCATSMHQLSIYLGWESASSSYDEYDSYNSYQEEEEGEEEEQEYTNYYGEEDLPQVWLQGRVILACILFPIISILLQFRNVKDLFWVCLGGLVVFMVGCVGTMLYSAAVAGIKDQGGDDGGGGEEEGGGDGDDHQSNTIWDIPGDAFSWKWGGIPNFVASTLCAMEGINLALPIANQFLKTAPPRTHTINFKDKGRATSRDRSPVPVVITAVAVFGVVTLTVAYFGYLSGLGGGSGTRNDNEDEDQSDCPTVALCLGSDLLKNIHRLSLVAALILTLPIILYPSLELMEGWAEERHHQLKTGRTTCNQELTDNTWNGFVCGVPPVMLQKEKQLEEALFGTEPFFPGLHRHWRYRISHAFAVCVLSILERPWERVIVLYKGIGLSIACFLLPVILFVKAYSLPVVLQKPGLAAALAGLMGLGLTNFVLVILSVFTEHNFLPEEIHDEGPGHHHESGSRDHF